MKTNFRFAQKSDLPRIVEIYNQAIKLKNVTADLKPVTVLERKSWFAEFSREKYPIWVIEDPGQIIGWFSLEAFYGRAAYQQTAEISIYLDESARGQNLGTKALEYLIKQAPTLDLHNLVAYVFQQNISSIKLFEKNSFERWGLLPQVAQIDDNYLDLFILGKNLEG